MADAPTRLARRLGVGDAVVVGLGSMLGAGAFVAIGPAAAAAGTGLLAGLGLAAVVAFANATSSAQLAAVHPASGGTYVYGRERLGPAWGHLAGWGFVVGKTASGAAMALTAGAYLAPSAARPVAVGAVLAVTAVDLAGVRKTVAATRVAVAVVLLVLGLVVAAALAGGSARTANLTHASVGGIGGALRSAGLLFFAFAGYARIATLGEEVVEPARTIPRAIPRALALTLVVYSVVAVSALLAVGPGPLARSSAPLATVVRAGDLRAVGPVVRVGAAVAALGVLLSLVAGVGRTTFAMAADGELPRWLAAVHPRHRVPHRAEAAVGTAIGVLVALTDLRHAIGFSSFCVLTYYGIANAAALTLPAHQRRWPRPLAVVGVVGCATLAVTLPVASVVAGALVLAAGASLRAVRALRRRRAPEGRALRG